GTHITNPDVRGMQTVMELALRDAGLAPADVGYVNAHGTATEAGDIAESVATFRVFGDRAPISSLKSYLGHTLGAGGALEAGPTPPTVPYSPPTCTTPGSTARPTFAARRDVPAAGRRTARPCPGPAGPRPGTSCLPQARHRGNRR